MQWHGLCVSRLRRLKIFLEFAIIIQKVSEDLPLLARKVHCYAFNWKESASDEPSRMYDNSCRRANQAVKILDQAAPNVKTLIACKVLSLFGVERAFHSVLYWTSMYHLISVEVFQILLTEVTWLQCWKRIHISEWSLAMYANYILREVLNVVIIKICEHVGVQTTIECDGEPYYVPQVYIILESVMP